MLAEILANPVAWPLCAVLAFAATMYPLGLLMPGCVCCGAGNCTQCGNIGNPYDASQNDFGRMCCNAGTKRSSITVRITNTGPASSTTYERFGSGASYSRATVTFNCTSVNGDYVFYGDCSYGVGYGANGYASRPYSDGVFPGWRMWLYMGLNAPYSYSFATCTGYPGTESCGPPGRTINSGAPAYYWPDSVAALGTTWYGIKSPRMEEQMCDLRGLIFGASVELHADVVISAVANYDTGCRHKLEIVA